MWAVVITCFCLFVFTVVSRGNIQPFAANKRQQDCLWILPERGDTTAARGGERRDEPFVSAVQ